MLDLIFGNYNDTQRTNFDIGIEAEPLDAFQYMQAAACKSIFNLMLIVTFVHPIDTINVIDDITDMEMGAGTDKLFSFLASVDYHFTLSSMSLDDVTSQDLGGHGYSQI